MPIPDIQPDRPVFLVLYRRLPGYFYACLKQFSEDSDCEVVVIRETPDPLAPFSLEATKGIYLLNRGDVKEEELHSLASGEQVAGAFVSGWSDTLYRNIGKRLKARGLPVIMGMDNQWIGNWRQRFATWISPFFLHPSFTHIWVAGLYQYEFARRLGFSRDRILTGLYSADVPMFQAKDVGRAQANRFVFTGRLVDEKGIDTLMAALSILGKEKLRGWEVRLIGSGPLASSLIREHFVSHTPFLQPSELREEMKQGGIFVLPSRKEPWGVVVHEFAAAGYPLLLSNAVGARTAFLRNGYNGFHFPENDPKALSASMEKMMTMPANQRKKMEQRSIALANSITPASWSAILRETLSV